MSRKMAFSFEKGVKNGVKREIATVGCGDFKSA
jgi:hypothetical protein